MATQIRIVIPKKNYYYNYYFQEHKFNYYGLSFLHNFLRPLTPPTTPHGHRSAHFVFVLCIFASGERKKMYIGISGRTTI